MALGGIQSVGRAIDPSEFSYSGDPGASAKDKVRWLIGDVNKEDPLQTDREILEALSDEGDDARRAGALCCEALSRYFAREADRGQGETRISLSQRSKAYAERGTELRQQSSDRQLLTAAPYVGGLSLVEKATDRADEDLPQPTFTRMMGDFHEDDDADRC